MLKVVKWNRYKSYGLPQMNRRFQRSTCCMPLQQNNKVIPICEAAYRIRVDSSHVDKHAIISRGGTIIDSVAGKIAFSVGIPSKSDLGRHYRYTEKKDYQSHAEKQKRKCKTSFSLFAN